MPVHFGQVWDFSNPNHIQLAHTDSYVTIPTGMPIMQLSPPATPQTPTNEHQKEYAPGEIPPYPDLPQVPKGNGRRVLPDTDPAHMPALAYSRLSLKAKNTKYRNGTGDQLLIPEINRWMPVHQINDPELNRMLNEYNRLKEVLDLVTGRTKVWFDEMDFVIAGWRSRYLQRLYHLEKQIGR